MARGARLWHGCRDGVPNLTRRAGATGRRRVGSVGDEARHLQERARNPRRRRSAATPSSTSGTRSAAAGRPARRGPQPLPTGLRAVLESESLADVAAAVEAGEDGPSSATVELLPPITDPQKIVCIGLNYAAHAAEAGWTRPRRRPSSPSSRNALAAPGATVRLPAASDKVDYEAEVAFVIGTPRQATSTSRRGARSRRRLHAAQRPLRPRPAVRRRRSGSPARSSTAAPPAAPAGHPGRGRPRRRDRDRDRPQRRAPAGVGHRRSHLRRRRAGLPPLEADDARARRHRLDRHPERRRLDPGAEDLAQDGDECVVSSPQLGELRTPTRR